MALSAPRRSKNLSQKLTKLTKEGPVRATSLNAKTIHPFVISCKKFGRRRNQGLSRLAFTE
jgi:hypothetical protein